MHARLRYTDEQYRKELEELQDLGKRSYQQSQDWDKEGCYPWLMSGVFPAVEWHEAYDKAYSHFKEILPQRFPAVAYSNQKVIKGVASDMASHVATQLVLQNHPDNGFFKPSVKG